MAGLEVGAAKVPANRDTVSVEVCNIVEKQL